MQSRASAFAAILIVLMGFIGAPAADGQEPAEFQWFEQPNFAEQFDFSREEFSQDSPIQRTTYQVVPPGPDPMLPPAASPSNTVFNFSSQTANRGQYGGAFPRTAAENGPPGFVRRRPQSGPTAPVLVPSANPMTTAISEEEASKFVTRGSFPNSYRIPGSKISYRWGGLVHLDGMFTFDPMGTTDDFVTSSIPVPAERGQNANFTPRWTRLEFETHADSFLGDVKSYIQVDFFNGNTQMVFGSYPLRLRFGYIDIENWRFGQDASLFMDYDVFPNVIDYEGPGGIMLMRQSLMRYTQPLTDHLKVAVGAEQPWSDITLTDAKENPLDGDRIQDMPDFTGMVRYDRTIGHAQVSGIVRKLTYQPTTGDKANATGYGINFTGDIHPWAWLLGTDPTKTDRLSSTDVALTKCRFLGQYATGYGVTRYIEDANGLGLDAAVNSSGDLEALFTRGWFAVYEHWWFPKWSSNFVYGENYNSSIDTMPADSYAGSKYLAVNLLWVPINNTYVGLEYLWGERRNIDDQSARARRIQIGFQYAF